MGHIELGIVTGVVNLLNVDASKTKEPHFCIALRCKWPFWFFRLRVRPITLLYNDSLDSFMRYFFTMD